MAESKPKQGLVQVYTGNGKGKTTAALGLAVRMAGQGGRVIIIQFLKGGSPTGEQKFIEKYRPFEIIKLNRGNALKQSLEELKPTTERTFALALAAVSRGEYDLVILDEILVAAARGLVSTSELLELVAHKPPAVELVLTGRAATPEIIARADLVTEMREIKHPSAKGIKARRGIEY
ncbi:MAG: cob(I)yrinic acid a,c-diamide adenosyltransferase [Dehalococcoidia bacterium]|nr:MAG: cob(I)yrinic acid a,c-diamide adenosyltransferase [Dehalococcoidia bacterium]